VGICGSELKIIEGKHHFRPNTVLGHEFCGEVIEAGYYVRLVKIGNRVSIDNNIHCVFCTFCRMGLTSQCVDIKTRAICEGVRRFNANRKPAKS
jgi:threonine dehydrogenase-like Zn-dependent dehydrogenase